MYIMFEKPTFITHFETFKNSFDEILMNKTINLNLILHFRFIYIQIFLFLNNIYTIQMFQQNIINKIWFRYYLLQ